MEELYNYIAVNLQSPESAMRQYNRIADTIMTLESFAERFRTVDSEQEYLRESRRMLVDNFSIFYIIRGRCAVVTNVLYSASDFAERLK